MSRPLLKSETRKGTGKNSLKRIREEGFIPGIVYGHNKDSKSVSFEKKDLERLLTKYGVGSSVALKMEEEICHAIIKDIHRHITKHHILHIDLQELDASEKVKVKIPLILLNRALVESSISVVQQQITELEIQAYPKYLPQSIEVDLSNMKYGEPIRIKDIKAIVGENIEIFHDSEEIVVLITTASKEVIVQEESADEKLKSLY
ncbi:MAG: 50S ribosomal protein L25 [Thermotaleaceae bacterium]